MPAQQIQLKIGSEIPAGRQIVDQLRMLIVLGHLKPGDQLPPVRRLALDLGIHFNTVAEAYRTLAHEGLLEIVHGRGARVVERGSMPAASPEVVQDFRRRLRELVAGVCAQGLNSGKVASELRGLAAAVEKL